MSEDISSLEAILLEIENAVKAEFYYLAIMMSVALPDICAATLGACATEHVAVEFARANASARAASTSNTRTDSTGKNHLDGFELIVGLGSAADDGRSL